MKRYKKRVYIFFYQAVNLGDDLFVIQLINRYPHTQFVMVADKSYQIIFRDYPNVKVYNKFSILLKIKQKLMIYAEWEKNLIRSCDYAVYIGGSIFMEYEHWIDQYKWYQSLFDNNRLFFLGCNWGPCKTQTFYNNMTRVLSGMKDVCFRDRASYEAFENLANVRYAPDILFGTLFKKDVRNKKQVFVSVIDCCTKEEGGVRLFASESNYLKTMRNLIRECVDQRYSVLLASFCERENDNIAVNKIVEMLDSNTQNSVTKISYQGTNLDIMLNEIRDSDFIIATRFHAVILGLAAGKPVLPVVYSDKTVNVLHDIGFYGIQLDVRNNTSVDYHKIICELPKQILPFYIEKCKKDFQGHFKILDETLKNY